MQSLVGTPAFSLAPLFLPSKPAGVWRHRVKQPALFAIPPSVVNFSQQGHPSQSLPKTAEDSSSWARGRVG